MPGKGDINPATGKAYAVNPATGVWDDNYWANTVEPQLKAKFGQSSSPSGNSTNFSSSPVDPLALAGSLQQMQIKANEPAIQTLQGRQSALSDQYKTLLDSVMTAGSVATNTITSSTNSELAKRGITNDSFLAGQTMGSALLPVTSQIQTAEANVGMGSAQDVNQLAAQIASLQTGNVPGAITGAASFAGLSALPAQIALLGSQAYSAGAQGRYIPIPGVGVYDISAGSLVGGYTNNNLSSGGFQILNTG